MVYHGNNRLIFLNVCNVSQTTVNDHNRCRLNMIVCRVLYTNIILAAYVAVGWDVTINYWDHSGSSW